MKLVHIIIVYKIHEINLDFLKAFTLGSFNYVGLKNALVYNIFIIVRWD